MTSGIDETPQAPPSAAAPSGPPPKGPVQRIVGALFSPNEAFDDIARKPDILVPLIVIVLISFVATFMIMPKLDLESEIREGIEANKDIPADQREQIVRFSVASGKVIGYASPVFAIVILAIIAGILLLAFRMMGGEGTFKQAFSVTLYSWLPLTIKGLVGAVIALSRSSVTASEMATLLKSNPAFLVDPKEQMAVHSLLSSIDLFNIWTLVLLIIGFAFVSRFSKAKSAAIIITLWVVTILVKVGFAMMGQARMNRT
jgi:hypothetical protein